MHRHVTVDNMCIQYLKSWSHGHICMYLHVYMYICIHKKREHIMYLYVMYMYVAYT